MDKLLVLGGKPIGSIELVQAAKKRGCYVIVSDYLTIEKSPAKQFADESWDISTADIDLLEKRCRESSVNGVLTAVHEFNINKMIDLCERLKLPCYCSRLTWKYCEDKSLFKALCQSFSIPVAHKYEIDCLDDSSVSAIQFPIVTKPVDGSGSRGFSVCRDINELRRGILYAKDYSPSSRVIIEEFIPFDSVIIHYTMCKGRCYFSGISDKFSVVFPSTGASVMGLQLFPSRGITHYMAVLDSKVRNMFETIVFTDGPIWIEAFFDGKERFIFNEMGYRLGGSLTNYPVRFFYQIDQLDQMISISLGEDFKSIPIERDTKGIRYCILPVHIHAGLIKKIEGVEMIKSRKDVYSIVPVHFEGDEIQEWGSAKQVFCYIHIIFESVSELYESISQILSQLVAIDSKGSNLLYTLYDIKALIDVKQGI